MGRRAPGRGRGTARSRRLRGAMGHGRPDGCVGRGRTPLAEGRKDTDPRRGRGPQHALPWAVPWASAAGRRAGRDGRASHNPRDRGDGRATDRTGRVGRFPRRVARAVCIPAMARRRGHANATRRAMPCHLAALSWPWPGEGPQAAALRGGRILATVSPIAEGLGATAMP